MTFLELVTNRQSDRAYEPIPVEQEKLDRIFEAVRLAPSACNAQPWSFIVVTEDNLRMQVAATVSDKVLGMNHFSHQAPVLIVVVEEAPNFTSRVGGWIKGKHYPDTDLGIAAAFLTLAATEQGLGSCIVGWFDEKRLRTLLSIPVTKRPLLVITLGYSAQPTREKKRKFLKDIVTYNND